jgi:menaquinone-dependent protoporphyrinogen oxidase
MARVLILYSTTDGHTRKICQRLQQVIEHHGHQVSLVSIKNEPDPDLQPFDKIVIGASIRYGKHSPLVIDFIQRKQKELENRPNAFFSVNVVARKPEKNRPETNPYLQKFLRKIAWSPRKLAVFAGKIDYPRYTFFDRQMIRFIMWMTDGPTAPDTVMEFTDWEQVEAFGLLISEM